MSKRNERMSNSTDGKDVVGYRGGERRLDIFKYELLRRELPVLIEIKVLQAIWTNLGDPSCSDCKSGQVALRALKKI